MKRFSRVACSLAVIATAGTALAQAPADAAPQGAAPAPLPAPPNAAAVEPAPAPAPAAAPALEPQPPPPASMGVDSAPVHHAACIVGDHPREFPDSARTATGLVCDALREQGVDIGTVNDDPRGATVAYVLNLDQLGTTFFMRLVYEEPVGFAKKTRRLSISDLSEAEVAAPRLASAMLDDKSVDQTQAYENIVGSEARQYRKKTGEFVVGAGIGLLSMPAQGQYMGPAFNIFGFYETRNWGIGLQLHVGDVNRTSSASMNAFSVGGRYFFSDGEITPLIGAGLALSNIDEHDHDGTYQDLDGGGTAAYAEAGVEMFRLHKTHLIATIRIDAPFYKLQSSPDTSYSYDQYSGSYTSNSPSPSGPSERYELPVTINLGIGF